MAFEYGIRQDQMVGPKKHSITAVGSFLIDDIFENILHLWGSTLYIKEHKIPQMMSKEFWRKQNLIG